MLYSQFMPVVNISLNIGLLNNFGIQGQKHKMMGSVRKELD